MKMFRSLFALGALALCGAAPSAHSMPRSATIARQLPSVLVVRVQRDSWGREISAEVIPARCSRVTNWRTAGQCVSQAYALRGVRVGEPQRWNRIPDAVQKHFESHAKNASWYPYWYGWYGGIGLGYGYPYNFGLYGYGYTPYFGYYGGYSGLNAYYGLYYNNYLFNYSLAGIGYPWGGYSYFFYNRPY